MKKILLLLVFTTTVGQAQNYFTGELVNNNTFYIHSITTGIVHYVDEFLVTENKYTINATTEIVVDTATANPDDIIYLDGLGLTDEDIWIRVIVTNIHGDSSPATAIYRWQ